MITPDMLSFIIAGFCSFSNPSISQLHKEQCMEYMLNCSMRGKNDGSQTTNKMVDACKQRWAQEEYERQRR